MRRGDSVTLKFVSAIKITWKKAARTLRFRSAIMMLYDDILALLGLRVLLVAREHDGSAFLRPSLQ